MLNRSLRLAWMLFAALALCSCESVAPDYQVSSIGEVQQENETRIFTPAGLGDCLFTAYIPPPKPDANKAAVFVGLLLSDLVSTGLSTAQKSLSDAAAADTASLMAQANFSPSTASRPACIEIISGRFQPGAKSSTEPVWFNRYQNVSPNTATWDAFSRLLAAQNVSLVDDPDLVVEFAVVAAKAPDISLPAQASSSIGDLRVVPTFVSFVRPPPQHRTWYRPNPVSDLKIQLGLQPLSSGDVKPETVTFELDKIQAGQMILFNHNRFTACARATALNDVGAIQCAGAQTFTKESPWVSLKLSANQSVSLAATITEARTPNAFVQFFADLASNSKGDIAKQIDAGLPGGQQSANAATYTATSTLATKLNTAMKDLQSCVSATGTAVPAALALAVSDEYAADAAALGITPKPFPKPFPKIAATQAECTTNLSDAQTYVSTSLVTGS